MLLATAESSTVAPSVNPPWWTAADEAEWVALLSQFVYAVCDHPHGPWPADTCEAFARLMDWRRIRDRISMAEWMRAHE